MNLLDYVIALHEKATKVLSLEWSVGLVLFVLLLIPKKYYILAVYLLRITINPISYYKYAFDKTLKLKGETFIPEIEDNYTINEQKRYKELAVTTKVRLIFETEEEFQYTKMRIRTPLSTNSTKLSQSTMMIFDDKICEFIINVSNDFYNEIRKSPENKKRIFIEFKSNKSIIKNGKEHKGEVYFLTDINFQLLENDDFLISMIPFMEDKFTEDEKLKILTGFAVKKWQRDRVQKRKGKLRQNSKIK